MDVKQAIEAIKHHIGAWEGKFPPAHFKACKVAIKALEKQVPEKPYKIDGWHCGACKKRIYTTSIKPIYCSNCGQKLDWGEEGE